MKKILFVFVFVAALMGCGGTNVGHTPAIDIISSSNPASGETNVSVKASITVYFGAELDETTITPANIYLTRAGGAVYIPGAITYNAAQRSITFTPTFPMAAGATHLLTITRGLLTKASNGADYGLEFTTAPSDILIVTNENPADPLMTQPYNIWRVSHETGAKTILTGSLSPLAFDPQWSPDYEKIVYIQGDSSRPYDLIVDGQKINVYVMNADGTLQDNITDLSGTGQAVSPQWSRDGKKIFYMCKADGASYFDICSINPDGTGFANLTNTSGGGTTCDPRLFGCDFRISPDGLSILYLLKDGATGAVNLYIMNTDGTGSVKLTNFAAPNYAKLGFFSTDGAKIFFGTQEPWNIYSTDIGGTEIVPLISSAAGQRAEILDVFPDGTKILYKFGEDPTGVEPDYGLYWMNADGTSKNNLVAPAAPEGVTGAEISPDGSKIAYGFGDAAGTINLYTIAANGEDKAPVTELLPPFAFADFIWSPNGDRFIYSYGRLTTSGEYENQNIKMLNTDRSGFIQVTDSAVADAWLGDWW
jgi:Tol biopolymer transport system component